MEEIVTGEAVVLDLPCARFPTRSLAHLIDMLLQVPALIGVAVGAVQMPDDASAAAVWVTGYVLVLVGYPVIFETLSRGKTLGKMAVGLRVVGDDGGPVRFRQTLVRGLAGAVESWALVGAPALITSLFSARGKRLGDVFAGTFVLRERAPARAPLILPAVGTARPSAPPVSGMPSAEGFTASVPGASPAGGSTASVPGGFPEGVRTTAQAPMLDPVTAGWAASLDLSALPDNLAASAASYLSRYWELHPPARDQLALQLAGSISACVSPPPPPGLPPVTYLGIVLAERRNRELRRYAAAVPPAAPPFPASPSYPAPQSPPPAPGDLLPPA